MYDKILPNNLEKVFDGKEWIYQEFISRTENGKVQIWRFSQQYAIYFLDRYGTIKKKTLEIRKGERVYEYFGNRRSGIYWDAYLH